jgi:hypothetical protein
MAAVAEEKKLRSMSGNLSNEYQWLCGSGILLLYKVKKTVAGGCNFLINVLSPAAIKIIIGK